MFYLKMAFRYLKGRNRFFFRSANSLSLWGIIIGVFSILTVSSVMNGFDADMRNRIIGSKAEIKVHYNDHSPINDHMNLISKIETVSSVIAAAPICENELLLQNKKNIISTLNFGIDYEKHAQVTNILSRVRVGMPDQTSLDADGIILGLDMSLTLGVTVGEYVQLSAAIGTEPTPFGLLPRSKRLKVIGLFISGLPEYDKLHSYISLENARYFQGLNQGVNSLEIKTVDSEKSVKTADQIRKLLGEEYQVEDWTKFEANLFNAIRMEKIIMFLVLTLMIIIASFNMSGNFIKLVAEKKTEIGILKAMGASEKGVVKIFMILGMIIGTLGTLIGFSAALLLVLAQQKWHFIKIPVPGFPLHWLPVQLRMIDFLMIPLFAILISFLTTLYPAGRTVRIEPIRIIRD